MWIRHYEAFRVETIYTTWVFYLSTAIEVPDKTENEVHIILKRDVRDPNEPTFVTQQTFLQFSSIMQKGMQEILNKMTSIQDLMVIIANNQHQLHQQRNETREPRVVREEIRVVRNQEPVQQHQEHLYPLILQDTVHSQEEVFEDDEGTEEYILDVEDPPEQEPSEVTVETSGKRRDSSTPKPAPKVKRIKTEMIPIQNAPDETRQSTDELVHVIETLAARDNIHSNVDSEEIIDTSSYQSDPLDIRIQQSSASKYEIVSVTEELDFEFPITSLEELQKLNVILANDDQMVEAMKHKLAEVSTLADYNFQKALQRLVADNLMHQLNWQGHKGKFRMKDMILFGQVLYQTWFQHIEFEQYEELLKTITKKAHKRYSKSMERKRHRLLGGPNRIVHDLAAVLKCEMKPESSAGWPEQNSESSHWNA